MNNLLKDSANNVFITSANILDKLTYKVSSDATDTVIPHNNDSLLNPLTQQLREDFDKYNQLLDDYNIELKTTEHVLNFLKTRLKKDEELKRKLEEEQRIKKIQEEAQLKLKAEQEAAEKKKREEEAVAKQEKILARQLQQQTAQAKAQAQAQQAQQQQQQQYNTADKDILDLDFGSFNFDQQVTQGTSGVGQPPSTAEIEGVLFNDNTNQSSQTPKQGGGISSQQQGDNDMMFGNILGESNSMDALSDLNLDFLDSASVGMSGNSNNGATDPMAFDMGDPGSGMDNIMASIDLTDVGGQGTGQSQAGSQLPQGQYEEDDGSLMPPDQMEHLFAQFDDLVQGNGEF